MNVPLISDSTRIKGFLNEVAIQAVYANSVFGQKLKVYRIDNSSGSAQFIHDTVAAKGTAANSFDPFSGSVIPNSATLKVYESTDGDWASSAIVPTLGSIASFKSAGWKRITFGSNAARVAWRPTKNPTLNMPTLKYIMIELDDGGNKDAFIFADEDDDIEAVLFKVDTAGGVGTAVKISDMRVVRKPSLFKYFDLTTRSQGDTAVAYTPISDTFLPIPGGQFIVGFNEIPTELIEYIFRENGSNTTYKVYATGAGNVLIDITSQFTSSSDFRQNGPATTTTPPSHFVSTIPSVAGFTKRSLGTLNIEGGATLVTPALYYIVEEIDTASEQPQQVSIYRLRSRQYGTANTSGLKLTTAKTIRSLTLELRGLKQGTGARALKVANLSTGVSRDFSIPTTAAQGEFHTFDFDDIPFAANENLGILRGVSGGATYSDVEIYIEGLN